MQLLLQEPKRERIEYPQINRIDSKGIQWIEINRGCKRQCIFCYADPNFKAFNIPKIESNIVQIIGEGILYDPKMEEKIIELGNQRVNNKVVYYGLSQGIDFRLSTKEIAELLSKNRFGIINNKGRWYKGIRFAWDLGLNYKELTENTIELLESVGYKRRYIQVFILTNWKISYEICLKKLEKLQEWGVKIDDCTYNTTKRQMNPIYWNKEQLKDFRKKCRKHNQLINFNGYDPERKLIERRLAQ